MPLVDQPLFVVGLLLFAADVVASYLDRALLPRDGGRDRDPRRAAFRDRALTRVALRYGAGQLCFATGLMVAGASGLGRKTYGVDQLVLGTGQKAGIALMAIGGALALAGGVTWAASLVVSRRAASASTGGAHRVETSN